MPARGRSLKYRVPPFAARRRSNRRDTAPCSPRPCPSSSVAAGAGWRPRRRSRRGSGRAERTGGLASGISRLAAFTHSARSPPARAAGPRASNTARSQNRARSPRRRTRCRSRRSEEHTSELQSLMRISYAGFCLKKKNKNTHIVYGEIKQKQVRRENKYIKETKLKY